jgi:hypothetical protein
MQNEKARQIVIKPQIPYLYLSPFKIRLDFFSDMEIFGE